MLLHNLKTVLRVISVASVLGIATLGHAIATTSVKAQGMAGATLAYPIDSVTPSLNPANTGLLENRVDLGVTARTDWKQLTLSNRPAAPAGLQAGTFSTREQWEACGEGGIVWWLDSCIALGAQWNNYNLIDTRYKTRLSDLSSATLVAPTGPNTKFDYRVEEFSLSAAYRLDDCHTIGFGLNFYFSDLIVDGVGGLSTISTDPGNVSGQGHDNANGVGVTFGWTGLVAPKTYLALAYSPKVSMERFKKYSGLLPDGKLSIPETWRFGVAYEVNCTTVVTGEFEHRQYSDIRSWNNSFPGDSAGAFAPRFGTIDGPGFGWDNQWIARFGAQWTPSECFSLRAGYRYEQSPIQTSSAATALNVLTLESAQHFLSVGTTWNLDQGLELSWFGEYGIKGNKRSRFPEIGNPGGPNFASGNLTFKDQSFETGVAVGYKF